MTTDELLQRWSDGSITADGLRELTAKLTQPNRICTPTFVSNSSRKISRGIGLRATS